MNTPQDPRKEPFQDEEIALARVLRALPGSEPSPHVDAAILAAARDATSASGSGARRHRRRGLPGWAIGTAAAAVLAVGIGLQLQPGRDALPEGLTEQSPAQAPAEASSSEATLDQVEVTGSRLKRAEVEAAEEADTQSLEPQRLPDRSQSRSPPPAAVAAPAPPPPPPAAPPAPPAARAVAADTLREAESAAAENLTRQAQAQDLEASRRREARRAPEPVAEAAPAPAAVERSEAGLPSAFSADDVLPPVDEDARLEAGAWLERIRERIRQGDRAGAGASLRRFERAHPDVSLPPDLAAFRP